MPCLQETYQPKQNILGMFSKHHLFLFFFLLISFTAMAAHNKAALSGRVFHAGSNHAVAFATIYLIETGKGTVADAEGRYTLLPNDNRDYHIRVSSLGYITREMAVKAGTRTLDIALYEQSVALEEFTVTAKYRNKVGSDATIGQEALEYIQPTSLRDVFTLLPGGKMGSNNMQNSQLISSRQVGSDAGTSFGMGISIDGVPVQNDGMRVQMSGFTGQSGIDPEGNVQVNTGIDLRTISTDHIESVTVTRGISSAKEGNLSSGAIKVEAKKGSSPLRMRVKFDPKNKLGYIGKGFFLGKTLGTLYVGADVVHSAGNIEDTRGAYNRITGQMNYNNQTHWYGKKIDMNIHGSYVTSFSNNKTDEMVQRFNEKYKTQYQRAALSAKIHATLNEPMIDELELLASADYTGNKLEHHKHVMNQTVMPLQLSATEGESEGVYLPATYDTYYEIDNRPVNLFSQLTAQKFGMIGRHTNFSLLLGTSVNYTKNVGNGAVTDALRPPFPSVSYIRPRRNKDIPALVNHAGYAEAKLRYHQGAHEVNTSVGLREGMMLNLPADYVLNGKMLFEPRLQASYTFYAKQGPQTTSHTLRVGYGVENKFPSADYLYPDKVYHDFIALNAYFTDESKRLLITNTKIQDPTNKNLRENKNKKLEVGYDLKCGGFEFSLTGFHEQMDGGVEYFRTYTPAEYVYYYELKHPVATKPTRDDFNSRLMRTFMVNSVPTNSSKVVKKGLEYRFHTPVIAPIRSDIEVNGAYYHTLYTDGVPVMYRPAVMTGNGMYPYVGIFEGYEKTYASNFNTNLWVHTHLPKWKLIFTNFVQIVWFEKSRLGKDVDVYPTRYMDINGQVHPFTTEALAAKPDLESLRRDFLSSRYNENKTPVSLLWNLKLTKEFSRAIKLSFFADNIVQISPKYKNAYLQTRRNWNKPFCGAELVINL